MNARGYSLLEVMISMVVLAVAFMAIIATQIGTLKGYVSARDAQQGAEIGRRTAELLRIQGSQWVNNVNHDSAASDGGASTIDTFLTAAPYDATEMTPFDKTDAIGVIRDAPTWVHLVDTPVDARFNRVHADITNHLGGKFCIYARGREMATQFDAFGGGAVTAAMRFQIAVVYPGPRASLTDCTLTGPITPVLLDAVGGFNTDPPLPPGLEASGFRVLYFGTIVVRRAHLTSYAAGG